MVRTIIFCLFLVCSFSANAVAQQKNDMYCNARFGFCIDYDAALLQKQPESQNGDGCVFKDHAGKVKLTVSGSGNWNFGNDGEVISFKALYQKDLASYKGAVSYKFFCNSYFVIPGKINGKILYEKVVPRRDAFCFATLEYLPSQQETYKNTINLIAKTFH